MPMPYNFSSFAFNSRLSCGYQHGNVKIPDRLFGGFLLFLPELCFLVDRGYISNTRIYECAAEIDPAQVSPVQNGASQISPVQRGPA